MNRFLCIFATITIFYLINQPELVLSSSGSGGYGSGGGGASKLNLGVWIPPMTLRLPKFNMPKLKISATIKPRKNQPPMKIHLPEMSISAKALGDDNNHGSYGSSGGGDSYSSGPSYGGGGSSGGGDSYSSGPSYGGGESGGYSSGVSSGNSYNEYGGSGNGYSYRTSASNQNNQQNYQPPQSTSDYQPVQQNYNQNNNNNNNNDYGSRYQPQLQDQRNAYYVDNTPQQQQMPTRYESVSYGASNSVQSNYRQPAELRPSYRSSNIGSIVAPLSNYMTKKGHSGGGSAYGYAVNSGYSNSVRYARH